MKEKENFMGLDPLPIAILIAHIQKEPASAFVRILN